MMNIIVFDITKVKNAWRTNAITCLGKSEPVS